jgi:hypothetical protein
VPERRVDPPLALHALAIRIYMRSFEVSERVSFFQEQRDPMIEPEVSKKKMGLVAQEDCTADNETGVLVNHGYECGGAQAT